MKVVQYLVEVLSYTRATGNLGEPNLHSFYLALMAISVYIVNFTSLPRGGKGHPFYEVAGRPEFARQIFLMLNTFSHLPEFCWKALT